MAPRAKLSRLTKRVVDLADGSTGRHYIWDGELRGFGLQVEASGTKTYIVRYRPKGHGRDGLRRFVKLGRHGDLTAEEAREQAKIILGQVATGRDPAGERRAERDAVASKQNEASFQQLGDAFLREHVALKRKPATVVQYTNLMCSYAYPRIGRTAVGDVKRAQLVDLHGALASKPHTANRLLAVIGSAYSFAAKRGIVPDGFNPARGIERYREQGRERYLTSDELQRLGAALIEAETAGLPWLIDEENPKAKHVPKHWNGQRQVLDPHAVAAIRLLLFTGARLREILYLQWAHVDLERGLLFLPDSKTGKKSIILNGAAIDILQHLRSFPGDEKSRAPNGFVIRGNLDGRPRSDLNKPWRAIRRHAELEGVRLHDLRHTFASIGAGASLGLPVVGRLLGHSQPQTTARYAHLDTDPLRRAADVIGNQLATRLKQRPAAE